LNAMRVDLLQSWASALRLRLWLKLAGTSTQLGPTLVGRLLRANSELALPSEVCTSVADILFVELVACVEHDRRMYLDCIIGNYVAASRLCNVEELGSLNARLSIALKTVAVEDFEYMLDSIHETLSKPGKLSVVDLACLIRLSSIMIHSAPQGSSKATQSHITGVLVLYADHPMFLTSPPLRREILGLLDRHFNDHPASIRPQDLSSIWSILGNLVSGSTEHDDTADPGVYQSIINIVSALVRLRRDLVLRSLPHLGMILRQLILALRTVRLQLGGKQTRLVMNTLPRWISTSASLGSEESKALARLLTTLLTKTLVRNQYQSTETQKPESLARPFSKHAAYVLTAYIEAIIDPLCTVPPQVRKELQPGLYALCDMLGEHSRDAMMVSSLNATGKATMKALWKDYEKQRYTGKG